jgi:GNAT superfamily N-acetyltransferase
MIKKIKFSDLEQDSNFDALRDEYSEECAIAGLPPIAEKFEVYKRMEDVGFFHLFGAYSEDKLVGFVSVIISIIPHYGVAIAVAESLFLSKEFRPTSLGRGLIASAEDCAKTAGSSGLLFSAPVGGQLSKLLPNIGYRETNITFFKEFP